MAANTLVFVSVVWGEEYLKRFERHAVASLLDGGNLPYLAKSYRVIYRICSNAESIAALESSTIVTDLKKHAEVEFVDISNSLGSNVYVIPLTQGFAEAIYQDGEKALERYYFFVCADFVFSSGSFVAVKRKMDEGYSIICSASLRANEEAVVPILDSRHAPRQALSLDARTLVRWALENRHHTVELKTLNTNPGYHLSHQNQVYWNLKDGSLLGRFFIGTIVALKPTCSDWTMDSFYDYSFVPNMCPDGKIGFISDSDEMFILEPQPSKHESIWVQPGTISTDQLVDQLNTWATPFHVSLASEHYVHYHSQDVSTEILQAANSSQATMDSIVRKLKPISHQDHHYWLGAWLQWQLQRGHSFLERDGCPPYALGARSIRHKIGGQIRSLLLLGKFHLLTRLAKDANWALSKGHPEYREFAGTRLLIQYLQRAGVKLDCVFSDRWYNLGSAPERLRLFPSYRIGDPFIDGGNLLLQLDPKQMESEDVINAMCDCCAKGEATVFAFSSTAECPGISWTAWQINQLASKKNIELKPVATIYFGNTKIETMATIFAQILCSHLKHAGPKKTLLLTPLLLLSIVFLWILRTLFPSRYFSLSKKSPIRPAMTLFQFQRKGAM